MENTLLIGLSRQTALARRLDVIANNVANMNTTGFKADGVLTAEHTAPGGGGAGMARRVSFVMDRATWQDHRAGPVQQTGNPLDIAVGGDAFLVVQTPRGERYTRNGALQLNAAGELVTSDGFRVLGDGGPVTFQPQDRNIVIAPDGSIAAGDAARGKLRLVEFAQRGRLQKDGASNFTAPAGVQPQPAAQGRVVQGAVERSNVQSVVEMTRLIDATRTYTQIAQMAQTQSDMRRNAIERLAEVPA